MDVKKTYSANVFTVMSVMTSEAITTKIMYSVHQYVYIYSELLLS